MKNTSPTELVLTDEQRMIRDAAQAFFRERGGPGRVRLLRAGQRDEATWKAVAELGWLGMTIAEAHGGVGRGQPGPDGASGGGLGLSELALVLEAQGRALAPEPIAATALASDVIAYAGSEAQKARWLPKIADGSLRATLAWDEEGLRGDVARTRLLARREGEGAHLDVSPSAAVARLDGGKRDVLAGAEADLVIVSAKDEGGALGLYAVERATAALEVRPQTRLDHLPCARLQLSNVAAEPLAGLAMPALDALGSALDRAALAAAAELVGVSGAAFDMTLGYLRERSQFGVAIGTFQALRHRAARMYIALELARSAVMAATRAVDAGAPEPLRSESIVLAKARASEAGLLIADESVQMHGGIGVTDEHDIGLYYKRARVLALSYGDAAHHRDRWARLHGY